MAGTWVEEGDVNLTVAVEVVGGVFNCGNDGRVTPLSPYKGGGKE